jgi:hypothetical protein
MPPLSALVIFSANLNSIVAPSRRSFALDRGREMVSHQELTVVNGVNV